MSRTGAQLFVDTLEHYGVEYLFGNPGTTELPVMNALADSTLEYRLGLHEDIAVGMAGGYARARQNQLDQDYSVPPLGVANLHVTPGLAHGLANLYEAHISGIPLLVTAGEHPLTHRHEEPILHGDLETMTRQFTKWAAEVPTVEALPSMLRRACRVALTPPTGPVFLALPLDTMLAETDSKPQELGSIPQLGNGDSDQLDQACNFLVQADEPVLVVGDGLARGGRPAVDAAVRLAEVSGARVHGELFATDISFPTDHDQWVSFLPPAESIVSRFLDTDTLVFLGCGSNNTVTESAMELVPDEAVSIHIGGNVRELGKNQPADAAILGDPGQVVADMADRIEQRILEPERRARVQRATELRNTTQEKLAKIGTGDSSDPRPSKSELVDALLSETSDAIIVDESVSTSLILYNRGTFELGDIISGRGGGLGYGLPAAIGAAMTTDRDVVAFIGDGSYLYYPHALYSAARYSIDVTVVIPDNRNYRVLKDNMANILGGTVDDYDFIGMDFDPPVDIPKNAESYGVESKLIDEATPGELGKIIESALAEDEPILLDVPVQD